MNQIYKAWELARKVHKKQTRFDGSPYINHIEGVVEILNDMGVDDEATLIAAILHDAIEDGESWVTDEIFKVFGNEIGYLVKSLTLKQNTNYDTYIHSILADKRLILIKIADNLYNLSDMPTNRMKLKYKKSLAMLIGKLK